MLFMCDNYKAAVEIWSFLGVVEGIVYSSILQAHPISLLQQQQQQPFTNPLMSKGTRALAVQLLQRLCTPSPVLRLRLADKLLALLPTAGVLTELTELLLWVLKLDEAVGYCVAHGLVETLASRLLAHTHTLLEEEALPTTFFKQQHPFFEKNEAACSCKLLSTLLLRVASCSLGRRRLIQHVQPLLTTMASLQLLEAAANKDSAEAASTMQRALRDHSTSAQSMHYAVQAASLLLAAWAEGAPSRLCRQLLLEACWAVGAEEPPPCQLLLCKAPTQEEFIRGSMGSNSYSSSDMGGPTMRDVKNFICTKLDMAGLVEDDFGMELLVEGRIVALGLRIVDVYAHFENHHQGGAMVVTYRLKGLDGDATEEFVETLTRKYDDSSIEQSALDLATLRALMQRLLLWRVDEREGLSRLLTAALRGKEAAIAHAYFACVVGLVVDHDHDDAPMPVLHCLARHIPPGAAWPSPDNLLRVAPILAEAPAALHHVTSTMPTSCKEALLQRLCMELQSPVDLLPFVHLAPALQDLVTSTTVVPTLAARIRTHEKTNHYEVACQLLAALCTPAIADKLTKEGLIQALHHLETEHVAAEQLLERLAACSETAAERITALREQTANAQRARAEQRRAAALASLAAAAHFADELEEEEACACLVCREGYLQAPGALLGVYALRCGDTLTSHMRPIHPACHAAAKRADAALRVAKSEWEGAALRNGNVPCNCIVPLYDASVDAEEYARAVGGLGGRLWAMARSVHAEGNDQLLPWVLCAAREGGGGEEMDDERWRTAMQVAVDVRAGRLTCEDVFGNDGGV